MFNAKHIIGGISVSLFLWACSDSATSEQEITSLSPEDSIESSSSTDSIEQSSESQPTESSSSEEAFSSSSSQDPESSSSQISSSETSEPEPAKLDKLPFDTTGAKSDTFHYEYALKVYNDDPENISYLQEEYGENIENLVFAYEGDGYYCHIGGDATGRIGAVYTHQSPAEYALLRSGDSLLFTFAPNCTVLSFDSCTHDAGDFLTQKITIGDDIFYYGEFKASFVIAQVTDSTVIYWSISNPAYIPPEPKSFEWNKQYFNEDDTLVQFISKDTIYIEKYNVKITDGESTWVFENEVCTTSGYAAAPGATHKETCEGREKYNNDAIECIQRNMKSDVYNLYPRLCRPSTNPHYQLSSLWCILDEDLDSLISTHPRN